MMAGKQDSSAFDSFYRVYFCIGKIRVFCPEFPEILHSPANSAFLVDFQSLLFPLAGAEPDLSDKIDVPDTIQDAFIHIGINGTFAAHELICMFSVNNIDGLALINKRSENTGHVLQFFFSEVDTFP